MRTLLGIVAAICGGVSLFRLGAHFWHLEYSTIIEQIIHTYQKLLLPITTVLGPVFSWIASLVDLELAEWWPHAFVVWVVVGGAGGRAWASEEGVGDPDAEDNIKGLLFGLVFGPLAFLWGLGVSIFNAFDGDVDYLRYLAWETFLVAVTAIVFFATNAFT